MISAIIDCCAYYRCNPVISLLVIIGTQSKNLSIIIWWMFCPFAWQSCSCKCRLLKSTNHNRGQVCRCCLDKTTDPGTRLRRCRRRRACTRSTRHLAKWNNECSSLVITESSSESSSERLQSNLNKWDIHLFQPGGIGLLQLKGDLRACGLSAWESAAMINSEFFQCCTKVEIFNAETWLWCSFVDLNINATLLIA